MLEAAMALKVARQFSTEPEHWGWTLPPKRSLLIAMLLSSTEAERWVQVLLPMMMPLPVPGRG